MASSSPSVEDEASPTDPPTIIIIQDEDKDQNEVKVDVDQLHGSQLLYKVLSNSVIGDNVCKYLTLSDMKTASETSKEWCRFIQSSHSFGESAGLGIYEGQDRTLRNMASYSKSTAAGDATAPPNIIQDDDYEQNEIKEEEVELGQFDGSQLLSKVLSNSIIGSIVCKYLTLSDMKAVSEVSKEWCGFVRNSQPFGDSAVLQICEGSVGEKNLLVDTECAWKGLAVDVTLPPTVVTLLSDILPSVNYLDLRFAKKRMNEVESEVLTEFLSALLTTVPHLNTLKLEIEFLKQNLHGILSNVKCQEALLKLKRLEIWTRHNCHNNDVAFGPTHYLNVEEVGEDELFSRNIHEFYCLTIKLESLILGKMRIAEGNNICHVKFIPYILRSSSETLVELSVHMSEFWEMIIVQGIHCPKLKRLSITADGDNGDNVASFINNHPHLEHLSLTLKDTFPMAVLKVVQLKVSKLKSFHLTAKKFVFPGAPPDFFSHPNWRFLSCLRVLKHFSIRRPFSQEMEDDGIVFLRELPATISSLELRGIKNFLSEPDGSGDVLDDMIPMWQRFENLSSLSLIRCGEELLTDNFVQFILGNFTKLQKLEFTHGPALSNFAITGVHPVGDDHPGVSLIDLIHLVHLLIKGCNSITVEGLLTAVAHPYLRSLQYLGCHAISRADVSNLVGQNPSLESIELHIADVDDGNQDQFVAELKKLSRRICNVTNLKDQDTWYERDSDSDADYPLEVGDSNQFPYDFDEDFDDYDEDH